MRELPVKTQTAPPAWCDAGHCENASTDGAYNPLWCAVCPNGGAPLNLDVDAMLRQYESDAKPISFNYATAKANMQAVCIAYQKLRALILRLHDAAAE